MPAALCLALPGPGAVLAFIVVIILLFARPDARAGALPLWWRGPAASIALGLATGVATYAANGALIAPVLDRIFGAADLGAMQDVEGKLSAYLQLMAIGLLFGGIAEETIFRGYLIGWGARLFGVRATLPLLAFSSVIFGLSHLYQGMAGVVSTGLVGLVLGVLYAAAGRMLAPCILAHMTIDAIGITELYKGTDLIGSWLRST